MRTALCFVLLASTAVISGCVDDGSAGNGLRYDDGGSYSRSGYYNRQPRNDGYRYRVPEYNEDVRRSRSDRYERDRRQDRYSNDRRVRLEAVDRDVGNDRTRPDRDGRVRDRRYEDGSNGDRDRRDEVCEYPCIR